VKIIDIAFHRVSDLNPNKLEQSRHALGTLVVDAEDAALEVAALVDRREVSLVLVTDSMGEISGVVSPSWVIRQISRQRLTKVQTLSDALDVLVSDPRETLHHYRHEWLNSDRPDLYWCDGGGHYVSKCPCSVSEHSGSPCKKEFGGS
jgi:hypothetical protein